jgi:LacI family transcriptional regulator
MATIHDVAKKAGVAPITVSRVINNSGYVSEKVRTRVSQVIDELGYMPNVLARSLKSKRTNTIALVFTDITNPFFNFLARGVEDSASDAGYTVIFCNTDESPEQENKYVSLLLQKQVDGILLVPADTNSTSIKLIQEQKTPVVVIDRCVSNKDVDIVRGDSEGGAYQMTKHLIDLGHKRITLFSGPETVSTSQDRVKGYRRAMESHGLSQFIDFNYGKFSLQGGVDQTQSVFSSENAAKPTAIFAANNLIAIGILSTLRNLGLRVPEDVAVVSFDGIPESLTVMPFLTNVTQPSYKMGQKATELLISRIKEKPGPITKFEEIIFPVDLTVSTSSGGKIN